MASPTRTPSDLLTEIARDPSRFTFFAATRLLECVSDRLPRIGSSTRPVEDLVRFGQTPALTFAPCEIESFSPPTGDAPGRMVLYHLGVFGPHGPLPGHLTDYAMQRERHHADPTFARFADVFHHRMIALFYRAWASAQPALGLDRPDSDRFSTFVASLVGLGFESLRARDTVPDGAKLFFSGRLAHQNHSADAIVATLAAFFGVRVRAEEFSGEWLDLPASDQLALGGANLDGGAVLGARMWICQHKFRLVLGPLTMERYRSLLPGSDGLRRLADFVRNFVGSEFAADVQLVLRREDVPELRLDGAQSLGWTTWITAGPLDRDPADLVLSATA